LTYLNANGPGDYEVPSEIGASNIVNSLKRNDPKFSMASKVKITAHPEYASDFLMKDSPGIKYYPNE
jgi:hypothetical protein